MRLSSQQIRALAHARDGDPLDLHCRTQSEYGGLAGTVLSLMKRGLLTKDAKITELGISELDKASERFRNGSKPE